MWQVNNTSVHINHHLFKQVIWNPAPAGGIYIVTPARNMITVLLKDKVDILRHGTDGRSTDRITILITVQH